MKIQADFALESRSGIESLEILEISIASVKKVNGRDGGTDGGGLDVVQVYGSGGKRIDMTYS